MTNKYGLPLYYHFYIIRTLTNIVKAKQSPTFIETGIDRYSVYHTSQLSYRHLYHHTSYTIYRNYHTYKHWAIWLFSHRYYTLIVSMI